MALGVAERQRLVVENRGLVYAAMKKLCIHRKGWGEAESEATLALVAAASTYEPARGAFSTWAFGKVIWALKTHMTKANRPRHFAESGGRTTKRQTNGEEVLAFDHGWTARSADLHPVDAEDYPEQGDEAASPEDAASGRETLARIHAALDGAKPMTRRVGLLAFEGLTKEEIAGVLGVSVSTVARRRKEARELLSTLRDQLKAEG
jgi:RNA polymerase sigma factor (sigma-70 family)